MIVVRSSSLIATGSVEPHGISRHGKMLTSRRDSLRGLACHHVELLRPHREEALFGAQHRTPESPPAPSAAALSAELTASENFETDPVGHHWPAAQVRTACSEHLLQTHKKNSNRPFGWGTAFRGLVVALPCRWLPPSTSVL